MFVSLSRLVRNTIPPYIRLAVPLFVDLATALMAWATWLQGFYTDLENRVNPLFKRSNFITQLQAVLNDTFDKDLRRIIVTHVTPFIYGVSIRLRNEGDKGASNYLRLREETGTTTTVIRLRSEVSGKQYAFQVFVPDVLGANFMAIIQVVKKLKAFGGWGWRLYSETQEFPY
jgi:hypothetical protein